MAFLSTGLMLLVCLLAWCKGDRAERSSAVLLLLTWLGSDFARRLAPFVIHPHDLEETKALLNLVGDFALAGGLLVLAVRFSSLWLGAVLLLQGGAITLHSIFLDKESSTWAYYVVYNLISLSFLPIMLGASLASWRQRAVRLRAEFQDDSDVWWGTRLSAQTAGLSPAA